MLGTPSAPSAPLVPLSPACSFAHSPSHPLALSLIHSGEPCNPRRGRHGSSCAHFLSLTDPLTQASPITPEEDGLTPLHAAVALEQEPAARQLTALLLDALAQRQQLPASGTSSSASAGAEGGASPPPPPPQQQRAPISALHLAARYSRPAIVESLLAAAPADGWPEHVAHAVGRPSTRDAARGETPLHAAVRGLASPQPGAAAEVLNLLVAAGAEPGARSGAGATAGDLAGLLLQSGRGGLDERRCEELGRLLGAGMKLGGA